MCRVFSCAAYNSHLNQWRQYYVDHVDIDTYLTLRTRFMDAFRRLASRLNDLNARLYPIAPPFRGGAMPSAHLALQADESREASRMARRNVRRGGGKSASVRRREHSVAQGSPLNPIQPHPYVIGFSPDQTVRANNANIIWRDT